MLKQSLTRTTRFLKRFKNDTSGNMAMMIAVSFVAIIAGVGLAVDGANLIKTKQDLQLSVDSAALAIAKDQLSDQDDLNRVAQGYLDSQTDLPAITLNDASRDGASYTVDASLTQKTFLMGMFGKSDVSIRAASSTTYEVTEFNLSLVLDTTHSMSGSKMASLKVAANGLIDNLETLSNGDAVNVSVIPFGQYVNVGLSRRNAEWLDVPNDETITGERVCRMKRDVISRTNCRVQERTCYNDGVPYSCNRNICDVTRGPEYESCSTPVTNIVWNGCVGSRTSPYHTQAAYNGRKIPGLTNVECGSEILPLTNDMTRVRSTIGGLDTEGETYLPSGIAWGWRALEENMPLTQLAAEANDEALKVMVVMTDGANTKSKNGTRHTGSSVSNANATTQTLCDNAKADGITIYTISYEVTDADTQTLMANCATSPANAFQAANSAQLNQAFQDIGQSLITLRLTN